MKPYSQLTLEELEQLHAKLQSEYQKLKDAGLNLNIARGKPCKEQLELSMPMLNILGEEDVYEAMDGTDVRNYGDLAGIPEARKFMGDIMGAKPEQTILGGNSSLNLIYDCISWAHSFGIMGSTPWSQLDKIRWLCPVPGYDRHFRITEQFGMELIPIPQNEDGPDMDLVEKYVNNDPTVKGIWMVPLYGNPTGYVVSDENVKRFAALTPAAEDFRIFWDNAYIVHHLYPNHPAKILNILDECEKAGHPDMVYQFCSTSKITFPGAGISAVSASPANVEDLLSKMKWQTIGHDKINQLRHIRFFKDMDGLTAHMRKHADIIRPKFEMLLNAFDKELKGLEIAEWTKPVGGYFISFYAMDGCAKKIVAMCKDAGLTMTAAGAAYPYANDPKNSNIRIAPTMASIEDLKIAGELFITVVKLVAVEKLLNA